MFIYELEVAERYRRRGIAKSLIAMITDIARREGMMSSFVLTNRSNEPAVALYQQMGGRIPNGDDLMFVYRTERECSKAGRGCPSACNRRKREVEKARNPTAGRAFAAEAQVVRPADMETPTR